MAQGHEKYKSAAPKARGLTFGEMRGKGGRKRKLKIGKEV